MKKVSKKNSQSVGFWIWDSNYNQQIEATGVVKKGSNKIVVTLKESMKKSAYLKRPSSAMLMTTDTVSQNFCQERLLHLPMARPQPQNIRMDATISTTYLGSPQP